MISKIFDNLNTAILCLDNRLRCRFINSAAEILLDISGSRSRGLKVTGLFVDSDDLESVLLESLTSGQPFTRRQAEIKLLNTQPITVDYTVSVFRDTMQNMLLLEMFPMSRYIRIDRDEILRDHQDATRQMVRGMAHEIKNPLGGIRGSAQLLQKQLNDPKLAEYTSIIVDEADRLTRLVDRMLGPNTLPKTSVSNIHEQLEKVATLLDTETGSRIEIARDYDPSIPDFAFDSELIVQTLLNIARNAMQALKNTPSPQILLSTRVERQFTIGKIKHRLVAKIDIADNGPGIPDELREKLFFPMISGRPEGTGLGLSLAQSIIQQHDGTIEFSSRAGQTIFSVYIPVSDKSRLDCKKHYSEEAE